MTSLPFDGYALGGSMGKLGDEMVELCNFVFPQLPADKPNHLLGIADIPSIEKCVRAGVDTFDSAFPTRIGRHGTLLKWGGKDIIARREFRNMHETFSPYLPYTVSSCPLLMGRSDHHPELTTQLNSRPNCIAGRLPTPPAQGARAGGADALFAPQPVLHGRLHAGPQAAHPQRRDIAVI